MGQEMRSLVLENRYRLDALVAEGGQAELWRARARLGGVVAVKLCAARFTTDRVERQRFLDEGYVSNQIPSEHVVGALDDGLTPDGEPFLVYPWIEGENGDQRRCRLSGRLRPLDVAAMAGQALDALAAAHDAGIVHRDIKPENLLIAKNGHLYVIDWGGASFRAHIASRTAACTLPPITPAFTAPEQARGQEATVRSDLFGLGATMRALLTGQLPRAGACAYAVLVDAATRPMPPVRDIAPDVPDHLAAVVDRATAFDPGDRYPSAAAMWADIESVLHDLLVAAPSRGATGGS